MNTPRLSKRFDQALAYMMMLHRDQKRKGTEIPYVSHLLAVSGMVIENGGTEDEAIAALLHDAIEDQPRDGKTKAEIHKKFGPKVLKIVEGCTDAHTHPKKPWIERKKAFLANLGKANKSVLRVVLADKTHNLGALIRDLREHGPEVWGRFNATPGKIKWYYKVSLSILRNRLGKDDTAELDDLVRRIVTVNTRIS